MIDTAVETQPTSGLWEKRATVTDRDFDHYCRKLGIKESDLKGKRVLDLGAGKKLTFAKKAQKKGIEVISINPDLEDPCYANLIKQEPGIVDNLKNKFFGTPNSLSAIAGIAQELPFKSGVFDVITSVIAIPDYLPANIREIRNAFSEMIRVLKPGGQAFLCSCSPPEHRRTPLIMQVLSEMENSNIQVDKTSFIDKSGFLYNRFYLTKPTIPA